MWENIVNKYPKGIEHSRQRVTGDRWQISPIHEIQAYIE